MYAAIYDFIIVGGGTAGLVLANRLTEDSTVQVLVLEAGEDLTADPRVTTPALFPTLLGSDADWNIATEPQRALQNRVITMPHGRALGGSSAINGQAFVATSKINVDTWGELGNPGWTWETLAPYFKKAHTLTVPPSDAAIYDHLHLEYLQAGVGGSEGPIKASFPTGIDDPLPKAWIETLHGLGFKATGDPFAGNVVGAYTNAASIDPSTQLDTIITGAHVQKLVLEGTGSDIVATGVRYVHQRETMTASAKEEVILSAGALHSPALLELSGIGDPHLLSSLAIPVVIANKFVGENLQDHPMSGISFEVQDGIQTIDDLLRQDPIALKHAMEQYTTSQSGPLSVGGIFSYAFLPLQKLLPEPISTTSYPSDAHPLKSAQTDYYNRLLDNPRESTAGFFTYAAQGNFGTGSGSSLMNHGMMPGRYYSVAICLLQPLSRGSVHIRTSNPSDAVKIDPRYLSHPLDLEVFARHMTYIHAIVSNEPFAALLKPGGRRNACAPTDLTDVDAMKDYARQTTLSSWHPTSTCAMLPIDRGGVVNERLVVHGTINLRVVDASVFPLTTRGNPMATVYAVAERAADLIKEDLRTRRRQATMRCF